MTHANRPACVVCAGTGESPAGADMACAACAGSGFQRALPLHAKAAEAHARRSDPRTSHVAARSVKVTKSQRHVLNLLALGPATADELELAAEREHLPLRPSRVRTALRELERQGKAETTGELRFTRTGRPARVWRLVENKAVAS